MNRIFSVIILMLVGIGCLGFYLGWFRLGSDSSGGAETTESSVSPPRVRSLGPIASTLASTATGLSLNRKLSAGATMRPSSIKKLPSRVSPVSSDSRAGTRRTSEIDNPAARP